jgi:hypothetical protein
MGSDRVAELRGLIASGRYVPFAELRGLVPVVTDAALVKASRAAGPDPAKLAEVERQREMHREHARRSYAKRKQRREQAHAQAAP